MSPRVLVVDDSPTLRRVVSSILERHGFEAATAADGHLALEALSAPDIRFDVVLVDFVMPRMNGFQFCRALQDDAALKTLPVVLMSARADKIRDRFGEQTGVVGTLTKPFDAKTLIATVEAAMGRNNGGSDAKAASEPPQVVDHAAPRTAELSATSQPALAGDVSVIPIGAVLQLLQMESQTGVLTVTDGLREITVAMREGRIDLVQGRNASSEFRLGRYFLEHGLLKPEDLDNALREQGVLPDGPHDATTSPPRTSATFRKDGRKLLGSLLVDLGRVTRDQLREALARQSSELVYELLRWSSGRFEFRRDALPALAQSARLGLPVAAVVMEGFRRVDEWRLVEARLGSFDAVLQRDGLAIDALGLDRLARSERIVLDAVNGQRTVREIIAFSHMSSFDACKILFQLLEARLVRRRAA